MSSPFVIRKTVVVIDPVETGRALRTLRKQGGVSTRKLGKALGTSPMAVSFYERGKRTIKPQMARRFVEAIFAASKMPAPKHFHLVPSDEE